MCRVVKTRSVKRTALGRRVGKKNADKGGIGLGGHLWRESFGRVIPLILNIFNTPNVGRMAAALAGVLSGATGPPAPGLSFRPRPQGQRHLSCGGGRPSKLTPLPPP